MPAIFIQVSKSQKAAILEAAAMREQELSTFTRELFMIECIDLGIPWHDDLTRRGQYDRNKPAQTAPESDE